MDKKLEDRIVAMYKRGMTLRSIANVMMISHEAVRNVIPRQLIRKKRMTMKEAKKIYDTYKKNGESYQETADILGIPMRTIVYRVVKMMERKMGVS